MELNFKCGVKRSHVKFLGSEGVPLGAFRTLTFYTQTRFSKTSPPCQWCPVASTSYQESPLRQQEAPSRHGAAARLGCGMHLRGCKREIVAALTICVEKMRRGAVHACRRLRCCRAGMIYYQLKEAWAVALPKRMRMPND